LELNTKGGKNKTLLEKFSHYFPQLPIPYEEISNQLDSYQPTTRHDKSQQSRDKET